MSKLKNTVLVVDADPQTFKILDLILNRDDFEVLECLSGKQAVRMCVSLKPDIILLDLYMPDMSGKEIIAAIREWSHVPVIIVSTHNKDEDVVEGLTMGADDYVFKPFNADVLKARINASLRKSVVQEQGGAELVNGPLRMDLVRHEVFLDDKLIAMTPKEYNLLRYLTVNRGKMLGHREILKEVWGLSHGDDTQYLRVFVGQIRGKIEENPTNPKIITTVAGIGYRMEKLDKAANTEQGEMKF